MNSPVLTTYSPEEMIAFAREHCPFYRRLYADVPEGAGLEQVPVIDQEKYWQAHKEDYRLVLTGPLHDGFVFRSGGTTGEPKYSYSTDLEWDETVKLSARSFDNAGLRDGDCAAVLFASGSMYASQMFATDSLKRSRHKVVQFPIGVAMAFTDAADIVRSFQINVLVGLPTHMLRLIEQFGDDSTSAVNIERIVYAGEPFSEDQRDFLHKRFPNIQIKSAGYASVDAGFIAYAGADCGPSEHRAYDRATCIEIVDEKSGLPINEVGRSGRIIFTNLFRRLMPVVRYPAGDMGEWVEPCGTPDRKFLLLGRSEEAARVATFAVSTLETSLLIEPWRIPLGIQGFQLLVRRENRQDRLVFRLATVSSSELLREAGGAILNRFSASRSDIDVAVRRGIIHPLIIEWIRPDELFISERTGKMLRVVDRRNG